MPAVSLISHLDRLFGDGLTALLRDPTKQTMTITVTGPALAKTGLSPVGWNIVMGGSYRVKTLKEADWLSYLEKSGAKL